MAISRASRGCHAKWTVITGDLRHGTIPFLVSACLAHDFGLISRIEGTRKTNNRPKDGELIADLYEHPELLDMYDLRNSDRDVLNVLLADADDQGQAIITRKEIARRARISKVAVCLSLRRLRARKLLSAHWRRNGEKQAASLYHLHLQNLRIQ